MLDWLLSFIDRQIEKSLNRNEARMFKKAKKEQKQKKWTH